MRSVVDMSIRNRDAVDIHLMSVHYNAYCLLPSVCAGFVRL
jgi:hypothetical protein